MAAHAEDAVLPGALSQLGVAPRESPGDTFPVSFADVVHKSALPHSDSTSQNDGGHSAIPPPKHNSPPVDNDVIGIPSVLTNSPGTALGVGSSPVPDFQLEPTANTFSDANGRNMLNDEPLHTDSVRSVPDLDSSPTSPATSGSTIALGPILTTSPRPVVSQSEDVKEVRVAAATSPETHSANDTVNPADTRAGEAPPNATDSFFMNPSLELPRDNNLFQVFSNLRADYDGVDPLPANNLVNIPDSSVDKTAAVAASPETEHAASEPEPSGPHKVSAAVLSSQAPPFPHALDTQDNGDPGLSFASADAGLAQNQSEYFNYPPEPASHEFGDHQHGTQHAKSEGGLSDGRHLPLQHSQQPVSRDYTDYYSKDAVRAQAQAAAYHAQIYHHHHHHHHHHAGMSYDHRYAAAQAQAHAQQYQGQHTPQQTVQQHQGKSHQTGSEAVGVVDSTATGAAAAIAPAAAAGLEAKALDASIDPQGTQNHELGQEQSQQSFEQLDLQQSWVEFQGAGGVRGVPHHGVVDPRTGMTHYVGSDGVPHAMSFPTGHAGVPVMYGSNGLTPMTQSQFNWLQQQHGMHLMQHQAGHRTGAGPGGMRDFANGSTFRHGRDGHRGHGRNSRRGGHPNGRHRKGGRQRGPAGSHATRESTGHGGRGRRMDGRGNRGNSHRGSRGGGRDGRHRRSPHGRGRRRGGHSHVGTAANGPGSHSRGLNSTSAFAHIDAAALTVATIRGQVVAMSKEQHGCRLLQDAINLGVVEVTKQIFSEVKQHLVFLMVDPFGNYLFQKLIEHADDDARSTILKSVAPQLIPASLNPHGTRAVQTLLAVCRTNDAQVGNRGQNGLCGACSS